MLEEFLANIRTQGLARPNLFKVFVTFPAGATNSVTRNFFEEYGVTTQDAARVNLFCETTELPGKAIATTPIKTHGPPVKIPYNVQLEDVPMVFYVGGDMKEKKFFDAWQSMIGNPNTGDLNYLDEYSVDVTLTQLTSNDEEVYTIRLKKAYPIVMSPMTVSMSDSNNFHRLPVVFAYRKWEYVPQELSGSSQSLKEIPLNSGPISSKLTSELQKLQRGGLKTQLNSFGGASGITNIFKLFN